VRPNIESTGTVGINIGFHVIFHPLIERTSPSAQGAYGVALLTLFQIKILLYASGILGRVKNDTLHEKFVFPAIVVFPETTFVPLSEFVPLPWSEFVERTLIDPV
jgi:hypothetical protein